ncbi:hypothetical protein [Lacipirellula sp.]|uniref:hypothetical protein n=1 Tax=Lacipirellula sp. TaxID=2691419 RepID=UPI003D13E9A6
MDNTLWLIVAIAGVMPLAWLVAEFQPRVWLRIVLGLGAMLGVVCLAFFAMVGARFETNSYYSFTSQEFIEAPIDGLQNGDPKLVLKELQSLNQKFTPTYESSNQYQELVHAYSKRLKDQRSNELD